MTPKRPDEAIEVVKSGIYQRERSGEFAVLVSTEILYSLVNYIAQLENRWVSVDTPPEGDDDCLCAIGNPNYIYDTVAYYAGGKWWDQDDKPVGLAFTHYCLLHTLPLPSPPEVSE